MEVKKIANLPVQGAMTETIHVLIEENGAAKRIPAKSLVPEVELPEDILRYSAQELTEGQKAQARANIGAGVPVEVPEIPEQKQADWNQNDDTAPDYVKGRTHYTFVEETTVVESAEYPVDAETKRIPSANHPSLTHSADPFPNVIIWNGVEYPFNRNGYFHGNEMNLYGNASLSHMKETDVVSGLDFHNGDTGEPFCFLFWNESISSIDVNTEDDSVTFELIYRSDEKVAQLDEKFIPDTIARKTDIPDIPETGASGEAVYLINYDDVKSIVPVNDSAAMAVFKAIWDAYYAGKVLLLKKGGVIMHLARVAQPNFDYSDDFSKYEWASLTFSACHGTTYSGEVSGTVYITTFTLTSNGSNYLNEVTLDLSTMIKS